MSLALASRPKLRFSGRSFLAFVVEPVPPVAEWLADLDDVARQSLGFFANRPVIVDLSALAPDKDETQAIVDALKARAVRIVAVEGVDPTWLDLSLTPLAHGIESAKIIDFSEASERRRHESKSTDQAPPASAASMVIDRPIRSGQSIFYGEGDLTVIGSVSSGAEIVAAGSIHIYGALRGRALAGAMGADKARIFCRRFDAELVAINGCYLAADMCPADLIGKPVQVGLKGDEIKMKVSD